LVVPDRAVIDTGDRKIVYVARGEGLFDGVEVKLGPRSGRYYPVIEGLLPGDRVAAAGAFLIDAETRLNPAASAAYFGAQGAPGGHGGHVHSAPAASARTDKAESPAPQNTAAEGPPAAVPSRSQSHSDQHRDTEFPQ
jgi:multidrug efflux pump subunit AcrA (membrane-fusion protein)